MSRTTVVIPEDLREQAKKLDINISDVCRYALEGAVSAARVAAKSGGSDYKPVKFQLETEGFEAEWVQFIGREVAAGEDFGGPVEFWYLTEQGNIVVLDETALGGLPAIEEQEFRVIEGLSQLRAFTQTGSEYEARILHVFERELGQAPTPRMLDI